MTALIVIFITLSLMGSALWVLPPKKERERMALRMHARKLGLVVQLTSIDVPDKWDKSLDRVKVAAYSHYRIKPNISLPKNTWLLPYEVWKYHSITTGWWASESLELTDDAKQILAKYQASIVGMRITPEMVALYWREEGDKDTLDAISRVISELIEVNAIKKRD